MGARVYIYIYISMEFVIYVLWRVKEVGKKGEFKVFGVQVNWKNRGVIGRGYQFLG